LVTLVTLVTLAKVAFLDPGGDAIQPWIAGDRFSLLLHGNNEIGVLRQTTVGRHQPQRLRHRLRDQKPVKRIAVNHGLAAKVRLR
jgi:hypothetical protein